MTNDSQESKQGSKFQDISRIQGTDGIRALSVVSTHPLVARSTPLDAFLEHERITEQFMELYAYAYVTSLPEGSEVVVGWDPRDPQAFFTSAVVSGVRKAGARAVVLGIMPTPGVALYQIWREAPAALMVTASHNAQDYNGLKIFQGPHALKLFPEEDVALTQRIMALDYARDVAPLKLTGGKIDARDEAIDVFVNFHIDPRNSWLPEGETLGDFTLVIDPARGALSGIAASVMRRLHGGQVIEVNPDNGDGNVNLNSGVADLEGLVEISSSDPRFSENQGVQQVFARQGKAAIFDADADRFFRLDYDPQSCKALLMSGDETAVIQAQYLSSTAPGKMFVNTVESDLNAARAARDLGYTPVLTPVGDKWVLRHAEQNPEGFAVGSEETGHNISRGFLRTRSGNEVSVYLGNGLKSAINTFVATRGMTPTESHHPFQAGFKNTFYVYYTRKDLFYKDSEVFRGIAQVIESAADLGPIEVKVFDEDPGMLYLAFGDGSGGQRAGIFVRNSGTEEKTGVNVRGSQEDREALTAIGEAAILYLGGKMVNHDHPLAQAELEVLKSLNNGPVPKDDLPIGADIPRDRLLVELADRQHLVHLTEKGYERTPLGNRMLEMWT